MSTTAAWKRLRDWERTIHPDTWRCQHDVLAAAAHAAGREAGARQAHSSDPVVHRGAELRERLFRSFKDRWSHIADRTRVLVHLPDYTDFPAGWSFLQNLNAGFAQIGVNTAFWPEGEALGPQLERFRPTLILSVDRCWHRGNRCVSRVDLDSLRDYRQRHDLLLALSCNHPDESALTEHLEDARALDVAFFYSSHAPDFVRQRYRSFVCAGFPVASCEFGANPMHFHPVQVEQRDLNFAFFGSTNGEKWDRYFDYFGPICTQTPGFIAGAGWSAAAASRVPPEHMRHVYGRAKVGINLHVPSQIALRTEVNERAYNLAACAVPQVTDQPALLDERIGLDAVYAARTPTEYAACFRRALLNPVQARERALRSMERVLARHTVLHRANDLMEFIAGTG